MNVQPDPLLSAGNALIFQPVILNESEESTSCIFPVPDSFTE
ncbi:MAG TPA: hypothetical protein VIM89_15225 [Mucilaginibacter sp.]